MQARGGRFALFPDVDLGTPVFDFPARDRIACWWPQCLSRAKAETSMMPRAADRVVDNEPLCEWAAVMCTRGADGIDVIGLPGEQDSLFADMSKKGHIECNLGQLNALG